MEATPPHSSSVAPLMQSFGLFIALTLVCLLIPVLLPDISPLFMAVVAGGGILGASVLLTWACEIAQRDIPQAVAVAAVAIVAVLPEYAVDMYFTWMAGQNPGGNYAHYAIANMTGANRLLIGVGWSAIVLMFALRCGKCGVTLEAPQKVEVGFLLVASLYAVVVALKGSLTWYDGLVFVGLYVAYIARIIYRGDAGEEPEGPAALIAVWPRAQRICATVTLFIFAAVVILCNAEPFSESLVASGRILGVNEFLLVQWLAPIASEAPEFVVALMFAGRGHAALALASLLSAKLNQWTLLVGMIPGVYGLASGGFASPIPFDGRQLQEILLTAGQSLFAVALLWRLRLSLPAALTLLVLFLAQMTSPLYEEALGTLLGLPVHSLHLHKIFAYMYLVLATVVGIRQFLRRGQPDMCGRQG